MAVLSRTGGNTVFGVDCALFTVDSNELVGYLQNASLRISRNVYRAGGTMDMDTWARHGPGSATLEATTVLTSLGAPLMAYALSNSEWAFDAVLRHARTGTNYAGHFLVTEGRINVTRDAATESVTALLQGQLTASAPAASSAPTPRGNYDKTLYGRDITSLVIGSDDYVNLYEEFSITTTIETADNHAVLDAYQFPLQVGGRRTVITASRIVEAPAKTPAHSLYWSQLQLAGSPVAFTAILGSTTIGSTACRITDVTWEHGGEGAQRETITLETDLPATIETGA